MKRNTLQLLIGLFSLLVLYSFFTIQARADGFSLSVSPSVIRITSKTPANVSAPFIITNNSNQPVSLKVGYKAFDPFASSNGVVFFSHSAQAYPGQDSKIFEKMQVITQDNVSLASVDLGPKQSKNLLLRISLPKDEPSGDYYFTLFFLENGGKENQNNPTTNVEDQKSFSLLHPGIGINVLLAIGENETPQGSIDTFGTSWFRDSGPTPFALTIRNTGQHFMTPQGTILITNMFGQTVGKITIPPTIILAGTSRTLSSTTPISPTNTFFGSSGNPVVNRIVWPEEFILGLYTATLTLSLSDKGPIFTRSIHFIALPVGFLVAMVAVIILLRVIYLRLKKKINI